MNIGRGRSARVGHRRQQVAALAEVPPMTTNELKTTSSLQARCLGVTAYSLRVLRSSPLNRESNNMAYRN
jgi:hypothetical protein